jgi:arginine deiminase
VGSKAAPRRRATDSAGSVRATQANVRVTSEIGALRSVICHTPGAELLAVTPANREDFLYDDIIDLDLARREHQRFNAIVSRFADVH